VLEVYHFSEKEILAFILVVLRVSVFFTVWPVFGSSRVPRHSKILLSLIVSFMIFPLVGWQKLDSDSMTNLYLFMLAKEAFVGIIMGSIAQLFFYSIQVCGNMVSDAIGLSSTQILNPTADTQSTVVEEFYLILVTMFFLAINGHHIFISGLFKSYELVPLSSTALNLGVLQHYGSFVQEVMVAGLKLSAPVFVSVFTMNIAMGVVGRAVPQMNVLVTGIGINILLGLFVMTISIPMMLDSLPSFLNDTVTDIFRVLKAF